MAFVVADDEDDLAAFRGFVVADEVGEVDAGDGVARHRPRGRFRPVAAIDQAARGFGLAGGLRLRQDRRGFDRVHLAGAVAAVVAHPVDVEVVVARVRLDLEVDGLAAVDADFGGKALDARVAGAFDVPFAGRVAGLGVLADDRVAARFAGARRGRARPDRLTGEEQEGEEQPLGGDRKGRPVGSWRGHRGGRGGPVRADGGETSDLGPFLRTRLASDGQLGRTSVQAWI